MTDSTRLDGQVAIVTGAAQGIGRGIAVVLAEAGASIVIGDLRSADATLEQIKAAGGNAVSRIMDTSNPAHADAIVSMALADFGRLDILVNNAGLDEPPGNAWDLLDADWQRTIDVNLSGVFYCPRAALKPMIEAGQGCIINISSRASEIGAKGVSPAYSATKAGVRGLTQAFSTHVADKGVRVNAVLPSLIISRDFGWTPAAMMERRKDYPLGFGEPRDIGEAVRYLASPAARWVSGTELRVTGGNQR
ncbi:MAG: SDR family NAD(P)-dependent oxidoreductase [Chloroflexi bacterium]|nr:SDR family NAD(P)-dependent oxidoreductase [Chloroflexota bacterium]MDA1227086.1 SDR family NAD(P)-dependent oxidoreductase [Chloroflexota bacterium]